MLAAVLAPKDWLALPDAERAALLQRTPREELAASVRAASVDELLALGRGVLSRLGVYGARLFKQERVGGELLPAQTLELVVRDEPLAARLTVVDGPSKGRRVVYNAELRKDDLRVREGGFLGLFALWISLDNPRTRKDSNHRLTDLGFGALLRQLQHDTDIARPLGGFARTDQGFDERGHYCIHFESPKGAVGLVGDRTLLCIDLVLGLPVRTEVERGGQLHERYRFEKVVPRLVVPANYFTPEAAGL